MAVSLTVSPIERGTMKVSVGSFLDESEEGIVPKTFDWTLTDALGNIVNSRSGVTVSPSATVVFLLTGLDLAVDSTNESLFERTRKLLLHWTYDSDLGVDLDGYEEVTFDIANTVSLTGVS